jgi:hypothetical protein
MKTILYLTALLFTVLPSSAQFRATRDVVNFLCEKPFYDYYKENKVTFKNVETQFAGEVVKSISVYQNDKYKGSISLNEIKIESGYTGCLAEIFFKVTSSSSSCTSKWYGGHMQIINFYGSNLTELVREGSKWPE